MERIEQLVVLAQRGDSKAFDALVVQCRPRVVAYCARMLRSAADGEQAAQDVFVQAWSNLQSFRFESPFENWLMRIATRTCLNLCRTKKNQDAARGFTLDDPDTLAVVETPTPRSDVEEDVMGRVYAEQLLHKIRECARSARPPWDAMDWHIFHLLYEQGVETAREVARRLDKSEDTVKYRIYKRINTTLKVVREQLEAEHCAVQHDRA